MLQSKQISKALQNGPILIGAVLIMASCGSQSSQDGQGSGNAGMAAQGMGEGMGEGMGAGGMGEGMGAGGAMGAQGMAAGAMGGREAPTGPMGFFVTSVGLGDGANLGGLAGADAHCQSLAQAAGSGDRVWRAYLSQQAINGAPAINARDRIGQGAWYNAKGQVIATDLDSLHYDNSPINREHALNERGESIMSRSLGDPRGEHDILTGSTLSGDTFPPDSDMTCQNWTGNDEGIAIVGHHDRHAGANLGSSWNSSHPSRGCSQDNLAASGGAGLFYCFAAD